MLFLKSILYSIDVIENIYLDNVLEFQNVIEKGYKKLLIPLLNNDSSFLFENKYICLAIDNDKEDICDYFLEMLRGEYNDLVMESILEELSEYSIDSLNSKYTDKFNKFCNIYRPSRKLNGKHVKNKGYIQYPNIKHGFYFKRVQRYKDNEINEEDEDFSE